MEYTLTRTNRKSISIRITKDAKLKVRAPRKISVKSIERFLSDKEDWINKHIDIALNKKNCRDSYALSFRDVITLRGKPCTILPAADSHTANIIESDSSFEIHLSKGLSSEELLDAVRCLLIEYAKDFLPKRTLELANTMHVNPTSVRVGKANSRWGSCNSQGKINYTWKIIMSNDAIIDYLIIHELSHLLHMNHSQHFWSEVQKYFPDYKDARRKLKDFQEKLDFEKW